VVVPHVDAQRVDPARLRRRQVVEAEQVTAEAAQPVAELSQVEGVAAVSIFKSK
jgi:hypothetical protein